MLNSVILIQIVISTVLTDSLPEIWLSSVKHSSHVLQDITRVLEILVYTLMSASDFLLSKQLFVYLYIRQQCSIMVMYNFEVLCHYLLSSK